MQDLILYPILGIIFLTQDSDPSQDLIPDLDLEISTNQLNVIIVTMYGSHCKQLLQMSEQKFS